MITENKYDSILCNFTILKLMATHFLEQDNPSFSKILLSKEVAEIIKQAVKESTQAIHTKCNDRKINIGDIHV